MSPTTASMTVVVAGNPNTGKSTVFNQLTGGRAHVANYPGITIDQHRGTLELPGLHEVELVDSPGTYSLSSRTADEQVAFRTIAGLPPDSPSDAVLVVVDASRISRNLYLALQILELNVPVVIALNMVDAASNEGFQIDPHALASALDVPVIPIVAHKNRGMDELRRALATVLQNPARGQSDRGWRPTSKELLEDIRLVEEQLPHFEHRKDPEFLRSLALWALLSLDETDELTGVSPELRKTVDERRNLARTNGRDIEEEVIRGRYEWIDSHAASFRKEKPGARHVTDRLDRVLLHPIIGFALFLGLMTLVFQALFTWADPMIQAVEGIFGWISVEVNQLLPTGLFTDFLVHGVIGGVGAFVVFLPQIILLFLFVDLMEASGYMARVAVLMDRIMKGVGLHGRAFVPMLSAYACAIPAIMATRNMERNRDRLLTMMVIPFMTCSARLPVYGLLIAAIAAPGTGGTFEQGLLMVAMYLFGTVMALICAFVLGKTVFKGPRVPLLIEMPPYRLPHWRIVLRSALEQCLQFVKKAGTIILICSIVIWALLEFPRTDVAGAGSTTGGNSIAAESTETLAPGGASPQATASYAGQLGRLLEPVLEPLGFDWRIGVGIIASFAAREVFVSTMGVVFGVGESDEETAPLRARLRDATWPDGRPLFTPLVALSLMIFFALACQCMSTLAVIRRETRSWRWPAFMLVYMTILAWVFSFAVYQGGLLLGFS